MSDQHWIDAFASFFEVPEHQARVRAIGRAGGCREAWLQGELYHHLSKENAQVGMNCVCISEKSNYDKADFHIAGPGGLIAECKVLATREVQYKMLDGHGIRGPQARLKANGALRYDYKDLLSLPMPNLGLLRDFFRLANFKDPTGDVSRLLILVMHTDNPKDFSEETQAKVEGDKLGQLLSQVSFGNPEDEHLVLDEGGLLVKIWRVQSPEARLEK